MLNDVAEDTGELKPSDKDGTSSNWKGKEKPQGGIHVTRFNFLL